ncbi:MAG: hypothetical protein WCJ35_24990 [Planctomycetota bacterium]
MTYACELGHQWKGDQAAPAGSCPLCGRDALPPKAPSRVGRHVLAVAGLLVPLVAGWLGWQAWRGTRGHWNYVLRATFANDNGLVATGGLDEQIIVWDRETAQEQLRLRSPLPGVEAICFSPDGKWLAAGCGTYSSFPSYNSRGYAMIRLWSMPAGHETQTRTVTNSRNIQSLTFSPDSKWLACNDAGAVRLIGLQTFSGDETVLRNPDRFGHIRSFSFSPDGTRLIMASSSGTFWLWEVSTGRLLGKRGHLDGTLLVAFVPDGRHFLAASSDTLQLRDLQHPDRLDGWSYRAPMTASLFYLPDANRFLSIDADKKKIDSWDIGHNQCIPEPSVTMGDSLERIAVSSDRRRIAVSSDGRWIANAHDSVNVEIFDAASGRVAQTLQGHFRPDAVFWNMITIIIVTSVLIFGVIGIPTGYFFLRILTAKRKYARHMKAAAARLALSYFDAIHPCMLAHLSDLPMLHMGVSLSAGCVLQGVTDGHEVEVFQYIYRTPRGGESLWYELMLAFPSIPVRLPPLELRPRGIADRFWEGLGAVQIDLSDTATGQEFNRIYDLQGADEPAIRSAFSVPIMEFFTNNPGWFVSSAGGHLLFYYHRPWSFANFLFGDTVPTEGEIQELFEDARRIVGLWRVHRVGD